jgi:hypothetical protein
MKLGNANSVWIVVAAVLATSLILFQVVTGSILPFSTLSNYEGAKPAFAGVWEKDPSMIPSGYPAQYRAGSTAKGGLTITPQELFFDIDDALTYKPNVQGAMSTIFIPERTSAWTIPSWPDSPIPSEWLTRFFNNYVPSKTYTWTATDAANPLITHEYTMKEYQAKWFIKFKADANNPAIMMGVGEGEQKRYSNLQVWFEINLQPSQYFFPENLSMPDKTYFAVASLTLAENPYRGGHDPAPISVSPDGAGSSLGIYNSLFGTSEDNSGQQAAQYRYQGALLNPALFREKVYTYVTLSNFGTQSWWDIYGQHWAGDVVMFEVNVNLFVVGDWKVMDIQNPGDQTPQNQSGSAKNPIQKVLEDAWGGFVQWASSPLGQLTLYFLLIVTVVIVAIVVLGGTGIIPVLLVAAGSRRGRRRR